MAVTFDDLPEAKSGISFDDIPDASHGIKFDDLPNSEAASPSSHKSPLMDNLDEFISAPEKPSGQDISGAIQPAAMDALSPNVGEGFALDNPTIRTADDMTNALRGPLLNLPKPENKGVFSGVTRGIESAVEGLITPENVAIGAGLGAAPKVLQQVAGAGFGVSMVHSGINEFMDALKLPTAGEKAEGMTKAAISLLLGGLAGKHALARDGAVPVGETRPAGLTQEQADSAARQNQLRALTPEQVPLSREVQPANPDTIDGLVLTRERVLDRIAEQPPETQRARQAIADEIDSQLLEMDRVKVAEAEARVRERDQSKPVGEEEAPVVSTGGPPDTSGRSSLFSQALKDAGVPEDTIKEATPPPVETPSASAVVPEEALPVNGGAEPPASAPVIDDAILKTYQDSAERIADHVASGQPTSVREAARDAALDNAMSSLKSGKQPSVSFMRKSAQEAAGKAAKEQPVSLDEPVSEGATKLESTPAETTVSNEELYKPLNDVLGSSLSERDARIVRNVQERSMEDVAAEEGLSKARVSQIVQEALPKLRKALEERGFTKDDYAGGPGAMGPVEALEQKMREADTTGLKRAVVDTERLSRGAEPIPTPERQREADVVRNAEDLSFDDPTAAPSLISRIVDQGDKAISEHDAALLLVERARLMNERKAWEERLGDGEQVDAAKKRLNEIEAETERLDQAQRAAGTTWGRLGHMYQRMIRDDFTLEAMERKKRATLGRPLTEAERDTISKQAKTIEDLQKQVEEQQNISQEKTEDAEVSRTVEATINELGKSYLEKPQYGKEVFDIARKTVDRWKQEAEEAHKDLRKALGLQLAGIPNPAIVLHVAKILRAKIGEFGLNKAEATAELVAEYGPKIKPHLNAAWRKMQELISKEKMDAPAKEIVKEGISKKGEPTLTEAKAAAKADATAQEPLDRNTVAKVVRALINEGVHGEADLMKGAHEALKESYPDITERDVRRAYSDYGKVKFPNKEAVATEMRELRNLTRLQESIDRITKDSLDPLKTGQQRDKATQLVREKTKQLNEILKQREGPPSPEKLASREEAKQTALRNAIEDIDKQLKTGEKPTKSTPSPDSVQTEQLRAERDAMKAKLQEILDAENPPKSREERYNATRMKAVQKQLSELDAKNAKGDFTKKPKSYPPFKSKETQDLEFKLSQEKKKFTEGLFKDELKRRYTEGTRAQIAGRRTLDTAKEAFHTLRAIMTGGELSGVLRQGKFAVLSRPVTVAKGALPAMRRATGLTKEGISEGLKAKGVFGKLKAIGEVGKKNEHAIMQEIQSRPNAELYKRSGLAITDPNDFTAAQLEGNYRSRLANQIPIIAGSGRAYTVFLNRLRADVFDVLTDKLQGREGPISLDQAKALATYVNESTGSGSLGDSGRKAAQLLNYTFFAPKFVASRFQLLAGHGLWKGDTATRKIIAGEYGRILAGAAVMYGLYSLLGTKKIETDPRSSAFGKIPIEGNGGTTMLDPMAGVLQATSILGQTISGEKKNQDGSITKLRTDEKGKSTFGKGGAENITRFVRSKAAPIPGALYDRLVTGQDFNGNPITLTGQLKGMAYPMTYGDIYDALRVQGVPRATALSILALFGEGVNTYKDK